VRNEWLYAPRVVVTERGTTSHRFWQDSRVERSLGPYVTRIGPHSPVHRAIYPTGGQMDTTVRDDKSIDAAEPRRLWLRWAWPSSFPGVALEHGAVVGRDPDCKFSLGGKGVSRRHAEIYRQGPLFAIKDLGSTNGTFVNGQRTQHAAVVPGAVLRIGEHVGVFSESEEQPSNFRELGTGLFGGHELGRALADLRRAASSNLSVVIQGATGTGKERVARAIHEWSGRKGPFHAINCAALPKELAEAELFGYRKGAFTGAERASIGHFRAADGGTLFLDEIADLPLVLQAKLLRVLEEGSVRSLGDVEAVPIDVRVVAATQRPLGERAPSREFREDLLARLTGIHVSLPALCERRADIAPLFLHLLNRYSGGRHPEVDVKLIETLCVHDWPANVRELEQLTRQLLAVHGLEPVLKRSMLPDELLARLPPGRDFLPPPSNSEPIERRDHDLQRLTAALRQTQGSVAAAASLLGFSRQRAYRLLNGRSPAELLSDSATNPRNGYSHEDA